MCSAGLGPDGEITATRSPLVTRALRWFMRGDNLCQQFPTWYSGQRLCFSVQDLGNRRIRWKRDNGETGVARISER